MAKQSKSTNYFLPRFPCFQEACGYVAALIDGEGNVDCKKKRVRVSNTDYSIINYYKICLDILGIEFIEYQDKKYEGLKQHWTIYINRRVDLVKLAGFTHLGSDLKRENLEKILLSYVDLPTFTKEELTSLYIDEDLSIAEIAEIKGCSSGFVRKHMSSLEIPVKPQRKYRRGRKEKLLAS